MAEPEAAQAEAVRPTRIAAVINRASGGVTADAPARLKSLLAAHGHDVVPRTVSGADIETELRSAMAERPDLLVVLGGDGTLARSAEVCGPDGPYLAALPGGTLNMLPFALNGRRAWPDALERILSDARPVEVSCGRAAGRNFYVAAILGSPAWWANAREAVRRGKLKLALMRARRALSRAFKGRLRLSLDGGEAFKTEAVTLMCPLTSRAMREDNGLEAAAISAKGALDVFRLGVGALVGDWRRDPVVDSRVARRVWASAKGRIPAVLDGEPHRLDSPVQVVFQPAAFRALVPADSPALALRRVEIDAEAVSTGTLDAPAPVAAPNAARPVAEPAGA